MRYMILVGIAQTAEAHVERSGHMQQIRLKGMELVAYCSHIRQGQPALRIEEERKACNRTNRTGIGVLLRAFWRKDQMLDATTLKILRKPV
ncbi:hypothetical protein D3C78_692800 [compost metagenome]